MNFEYFSLEQEKSVKCLEIAAAAQYKCFFPSLILG